MNIFILTFHKYDKAFASDLYLIYNRSPAARVCKSDTDRLLMLYLVLNILLSASLETLTFNTSRLTAVETINSICTCARKLRNIVDTDCKLLVTTMEIALGLALFPQTSIFFSRHPYITVFRFEICEHTAIYIYISF